MNVLSIVLIVVGCMIVLTAIAVLIFRTLARRSEISFRPCYRCGVVATSDYMGLHYCLMCRVVVVQMMQAVRHDPPFGFPGGPGYLAWPKELTEEMKKSEEQKKEGTNNG